MPNVSFTRENGEKIELSLEKDEVIFEGFERQGIELPFGCLSGSCSACKAQVIKGHDNLSMPGAIEQNTITAIHDKSPHLEKESIRLTCRAKVLGDVDLKFFPKS